MYHRIVEAKIRRTFHRLNAGDYDAVIAQMAPAFSYHFAGDHALSGTRTRTDSLRLWFTRLLTVFPSAHFAIAEVLVRGWPWRTSVAVFATLHTVVAGQPYSNSFSQHITMRWGRVVSIDLLEDSQQCAAALARQAAAGIADAVTPPIDDTTVTISRDQLTH